VVVLVLVACKGGDTGSDDDPRYGSGRNGVDVPSGLDVAQLWEGDLSEGQVPSSLDFLEDYYCATGTEFVNFDGAHVYYTYEQPAGVQVYVTATPERGVDVSLIVSQAPAGTSGTGAAAIVDPCEISADLPNDNNPGESESVKVTSIDKGYHLIIGVAGAGGITEGAFKVEVFED
jgi:hypothetical protein